MAVTEEKNALGVTVYKLDNDKISEEITIAFLADLHNYEFGERNSRLIEAVKLQTPDIIAIGGDMNLRSSFSDDVIIELLKSLTLAAPVYYCIGNHEKYIAERGGTILEDIRSTDAVLLDNEKASVIVKGQTVLIGGLTGNPDYYTKDRAFLNEFASADEFKLLLCHYPEYQWAFMDLPIDAALCGHAHGGLIKLPYIGPLFAPTQKLFPKYTEGVFTSEKATMVISRGLGNSTWIPRINNPPELVIIKIS